MDTTTPFNMHHYRPFSFRCTSEAEFSLNEVALVRISWLRSMSR